jgi:hypothetical protein
MQLVPVAASKVDLPRRAQVRRGNLLVTYCLGVVWRYLEIESGLWATAHFPSLEAVVLLQNRELCFQRGWCSWVELHLRL